MIHSRFYFILICVVVILNMMLQVPRFNFSFKKFQTINEDVLGREFVFLQPAFKNIHDAGYISCVESQNPLEDVRIMGPYQEAQVVLAPAILDYFHPLAHRYILLHCHRYDRIHQIQEQLSAQLIADQGQGAVLLDRGPR